MAGTELLLLGAAGLLLAGLITFLVLFIVARRQLGNVRRELTRLLAEQDDHRRRRRRGVAPLALKTVFQTADMLINKGLAPPSATRSKTSPAGPRSNGPTWRG